MKQILIPTDFSENANHALNFALVLATDFGATLHVINSYKMPYSSSSPMTRTLLDTLKESSLDDLAKCLAHIKSNPEFKDLNVKTQAFAGDVVNSIDEYANKIDADVVVMGTKGVSGIEEMLIGSNAEEVVIHSDKPVIIVPENSQISSVKKVAFAADLQSINNPDVLQSYISFAKKYKADTLMVNVGKDPSNSQSVEKLEEVKKLDKLFSDVSHSFHFEDNEDVINGINKFVKLNECDMLTLFSRRHNFFEKIFHKSVTNKLTCQAELPIFVIKET